MVETYFAKLGEDGRVLIPSVCRNLLSLQKGEQMLITIENGGMRMASAREALRQFRNKVRERVGPETRLMDDLRQLRADNANSA